MTDVRTEICQKFGTVTIVTENVSQPSLMRSHLKENVISITDKITNAINAKFIR